MVIRPATWDDLDAVFDLLSTRDRALYGISDLQLEHLRIDWELPSFTVGLDNWVAEAGGALAGYASLEWGHNLVHTAADPDTGDALLGPIVERARALGLESLQLKTAGGDDFARRNGFELQTEIVRMWKTLHGGDPAPVWPAGVAVRTYEPSDGERVHALLDEAYSAWDPRYVPLAHDDWVTWMTESSEFDPAAWFLVVSGDELLGCALHWNTGWLKDIVVRASERGRGLGTALLLHGFAEFKRRGIERMGLKVDAGNPTGAMQLYERHGFVADRREEIWMLWL
ncbi:MAG TPA: GNAT family N-acetyltransferase [Fimbriimonas sp.]|nr:GNAT family N-acetyltransferase [Fimbriimonas sp.]